MADVALKARSLYERKHKKKFVQGRKSIGLGKSIKPTHNHKKQQKNDDPQIPQPDLRFASGETKQTAKPKQTQNGARAQTEHPRNRFAIRCSGFHCIICKSLPNQLISRLQANMEARAGILPSCMCRAKQKGQGCN